MLLSCRPDNIQFNVTKMIATGAIFSICNSQTYLTVVECTTYWCYSKSQQLEYRDNGFLFGGLHALGTNNIATGSQSCPPNHSSVKIANTAYIRISGDYENAGQNAIPFAGFYSKQNGHPLSNTSADGKSCPKGSSQSSQRRISIIYMK